MNNHLFELTMHLNGGLGWGCGLWHRSQVSVMFPLYWWHMICSILKVRQTCHH